MLLGVPPILLIGAWSSVRVWRGHDDVANGARWAVGDSGTPGYQSFLLPGTTAIVLIWLALLASQIWNPDSMPGGVIPIALFAASILALVLAFCVWLFMWPRFLVPPRLRGQPGWLTAARRAHHEARKGRDEI